MTKNKQAILDLVLASYDHLTAAQIYDKLREAGHRMTLATVYNNLHALAAEGAIQSLSFEGMGERFDKPHRHDHMVCNVCGKVADVHLEDITAALRHQAAVDLDSYEIRLFYTCDTCKAAA